MLRTATLALVVAFAVTGCQKDKDSESDSEGEGASSETRADPTAAPDNVAEPPEDAETTDSGLAYTVLEKGDGGASPNAKSRVKVHYTGWTTDGKMFDSSRERGKPATFPLNRVIAGWTEGLQLMSEGDEYRLWIPEDLAYKGQSGKPEGMLVFDVALLDVIEEPDAPANLEAPPDDAQTTDSGLAYKVLEEGDGGDSPRPWDKVKVHYSGWTTDGKMFDSSVMKGEPKTFPLTGMLKGWSEGVQLMSKGAKYRLWIPEELAYENNPRGPQGMLIFDVELLDVEKMPEPPEAPDTVSGPPADADKTDKGVHYKVLEKGDGDERPTKKNRVKVHYTGWTTDGKMFDSSVNRGEPAEFPLSGVIPGWADGIQTMVVGQKSRFWIPAKLAYEGNPRGPQGMLVFDVELLEIKEGRRTMPRSPHGATGGKTK